MRTRKQNEQVAAEMGYSKEEIADPSPTKISKIAVLKLVVVIRAMSLFLLLLFKVFAVSFLLGTTVIIKLTN